MPDIRNRDDWESLDPFEKEAYLDALEAVSLMRREGSSLEDAARRVGLTESDVLDFAGGEVVHTDGQGSWIAEPSDDLYRQMRILTDEGVDVVEVLGSENASRVGGYWSAVRHFLRTGDTSRLRGFPEPLLTDPDEVVAWWRRGELDFLEIYDT